MRIRTTGNSAEGPALRVAQGPHGGKPAIGESALRSHDEGRSRGMGHPRSAWATLGAHLHFYAITKDHQRNGFRFCCVAFPFSCRRPGVQSGG